MKDLKTTISDIIGDYRARNYYDSMAIWLASEEGSIEKTLYGYNILLRDCYGEIINIMACDSSEVACIYRLATYDIVRKKIMLCVLGGKDE